ncbi:hypothetical protein N4G70_35425 [Streptomyces sp. ASQP_92]|uniref:hypothetical protein n=1 Tax=Streptomyces sp. ASQP_92 TaxID=2979116 RepID=UPI0021C1AA76|nr:hypothetical protein [Streptomyces sp. ASQP_92]MCT9094100.1 hypothetical protein [Streptomyces sp. ASQP_92]
MTDNEELFSADLIGKRLLRVTTAWHHYAEDEPSLLHLWLDLEGLGPVLFHTPSTGLSLRIDQPHESYSMDDYGVTVVHNSPDVPVTRFVGQPIRSVRDISYRDGHVAFTAGLTLQFPCGSIRLLALDDDLVIAHHQYLGPVEAHLHEDVTLAPRGADRRRLPVAVGRMDDRGPVPVLRYRHGEGSVEQHPSEDTDTWDGEESRL